MKRILLLFLTVSLFVVVLFVLSPSVFAAEDASAETLDFYFGGKLFSSYPYNQQDLYWSDICDFELEDGVGFVLDEQGVVNYIVNDDLYYVFDSDHQMIKGTDDLKPCQYSLELVLEFSLIETNLEGYVSANKYTFTGLVPSLRLEDIVRSNVLFNNDFYGKCCFEYFGDYIVAFVTGIDESGFSDEFLLCTSSDPFDFERIILTNSNLTSVSYYALSVCSSGLHNFGPTTYLKFPTCTEEGVTTAICYYCNQRKTWKVHALGHDKNFWGECRRCGSNLFGNIGTNIGNGVSDLLDGAQNVGDAIIDGANDLIDKGKDALDEGKDAVGEKVSSFVTTIAIVAGLSIGIPVAILITRLAKKLKKKK